MINKLNYSLYSTRSRSQWVCGACSARGRPKQGAAASRIIVISIKQNFLKLIICRINMVNFKQLIKNQNKSRFPNSIAQFKKSRMLLHSVLVHCTLMSTLYTLPSFDNKIRVRAGNMAQKRIFLRRLRKFRSTVRRLIYVYHGRHAARRSMVKINFILAVSFVD